VKLEVAGITLYVHRAVSYLFKEFIEELASKGYSVAKGRDDWGYANRNIFIRGRDTGRKSNHSWGLAVDLNATANAVSYDGRVHTNLPKNVSEIAKKYDLFWGGDYSASSYRDPMHFEFLDRPRDAVLATARVRALKTQGTPKVSQVSRLPGRWVTVQKGDTYQSLSARFYGDTEYWRILRNANHDLPLQIGLRIYVPERFTKRQYKVIIARKNDTYRTLSRRYYGTKRKWRRIKGANAGKPLRRGTKVKVPV
ncbi:MAG TPA: M15 family metallopeptidase, partial [Patescibacteria group bacterium]|nr:M15 family metallopeptidase [Patescibacteria group bacterium]